MRVGLVSLGCTKNQVDSEIMLGLLAKNNYTIERDPDQADAIIVNTCGFIDSAKEEAIDTILEMADKKKSARLKYLIVAGCLAQRYAKDLEREIPEIDGIIGIGAIDKLINCLENLENKYIDTYMNMDLSYLKGDRILTSPPGVAYIKVAEGCDNRCHYCAIPSIRGVFRSRPIEDILKEANDLVDQGIKEIILIAQDTTRYGKDLYGEPRLIELLEDLNKIEDLYMIRVMYLYPDEITSSLIDTFKRLDKLAKYIDLPLQHISDSVLTNMNRRGTSKEIRDIISRFRQEIDGIVIRTSFIVGYPGEGKKDFNELCNFVKEIRFDNLGVFTYSREEKTKASSMKKQVSEKIKQERYNKIMEIQQEISYANKQKLLDKTYRTIVEGISDDGIFYYGRSYAQAPEIDGYIYFTSEEPLDLGQLVDVKILMADEYDLTGTCL